MLYPQNNRCRSVMELSGFWELKVDDEDKGEDSGWSNGFKSDMLVGVPGSWNEQLAESGLMNYIGQVWFQKKFYLNKSMSESQIFIRFGSVDYQALVWINGKFVGEHVGGYLPFVFKISNYIDFNKENLIVVKVDNRLSHDTIPQGISGEDFSSFDKEREQTYPSTVFDFFIYGGIQRPVRIFSTHPLHLKDVHLRTRIFRNNGIIKYKAEYSQYKNNVKVKIILKDGEQNINETSIPLEADKIDGEFTIPDCRFWSPSDPHLYQLKFEIHHDELLIDEYELEVGIREIEIKGDKLLLNGKPVFLRGFGKHEDFAVLGKGLSYPLIVKDFQLMKWIGANSFRTSHYPYAEEIIQMADKLGILVIGEVPAVSLNFKFVTDRTFANHKRAIAELISRDKNHPSVISWCVANEPGIWGEAESISQKAEQYWDKIFEYARKLDQTRPFTIPTFPRWKEKDLVYKHCDFISINRYRGWYEIPGDLDKAGKILKQELIKLHEKYNKPILLSEFGADTIEGLHETFPQMFTEEYQTALIKKYFEVIESLDFTIGEHIWNFADFRTAQHFRRVVLNRKGIFNRQRQPKAAAFVIREHWGSDS